MGDITKGLDDPTNIREPILDIIKEWERMCNRASEFYVAPKDFSGKRPLSGFSEAETAFTDAILRGAVKWSDGKHPAPLNQRYQVWRWDLPIPWTAACNGSKWMNKAKFLERYDKILFSLIHGCQMFVTRKGLIGMVGADCHAQAGDEIDIIHGATTPCIIRIKKNCQYA